MPYLTGLRAVTLGSAVIFVAVALVLALPPAQADAVLSYDGACTAELQAGSGDGILLSFSCPTQSVEGVGFTTSDVTTLGGTLAVILGDQGGALTCATNRGNNFLCVAGPPQYGEPRNPLAAGETGTAVLTDQYGPICGSPFLTVTGLQVNPSSPDVVAFPDIVVNCGRSRAVGDSPPPVGASGAQLGSTHSIHAGKGDAIGAGGPATDTRKATGLTFGSPRKRAAEHAAGVARVYSHEGRRVA